MTVLVNHGVVTGCAVTAQASPDMTVAIASGVVVDSNATAATAAVNASIHAADVTYDRIDLVTMTSSGNVLVAIGAPSATPMCPDSSEVPLASVYVYGQANPNYTGTIVASVISDLRRYVVIQQPAQTFAMTYLATAGAGSDPGGGKCQFDSTTFSSVAHCYVSYTSASAPSSLKTWFQNNLTATGAYYLRLWSKQDPSKWGLVKVTSFTDHSTYCDLAVAGTAQSSGGASLPLFTDALDTVLEFSGFA